MPNPQQLKERIYALNPELKTLTMGCELILKGKEDNVYAKDVYINLQDIDKDESKTLIRTLHCNMTALGRYGILGHPIHLEHVLKAMTLSLSTSYVIDSMGYIFEIVDAYDDIVIKKVGIKYNLTKTFDQNIAENEELVTFLLNIIK